MATLTADQFEERLARYLYETSEEARAVRVGTKETSELAAVVARYADLFGREQHAALRDEAESTTDDDERERLVRLREACAGGVVMAELADLVDQLENETLAQRVEFRGESVPLRSAQASSKKQRPWQQGLCSVSKPRHCRFHPRYPGILAFRFQLGRVRGRQKECAN